MPKYDEFLIKIPKSDVILKVKGFEDFRKLMEILFDNGYEYIETKYAN